MPVAQAYTREHDTQRRFGCENQQRVVAGIQASTGLSTRARWYHRYQTWHGLIPKVHQADTFRSCGQNWYPR